MMNSQHISYLLCIQTRSLAGSYSHSSQTEGEHSAILAPPSSKKQLPGQSITTDFCLKREQMSQIIQKIISK